MRMAIANVLSELNGDWITNKDLVLVLRDKVPPEWGIRFHAVDLQLRMHASSMRIGHSRSNRAYGQKSLSLEEKKIRGLKHYLAHFAYNSEKQGHIERVWIGSPNRAASEYRIRATQKGLLHWKSNRWGRQ